MSDLFDSHLNDLGTLKVSIFHGTLDDVNSFAEMKDAYNKLRQKGITVTLTSYPLGHTYTTEILNSVLHEAK